MTIKDLAKKTGYAVGTVSRALNNHPNVSPTARETILRVAEESGFELNINAKQLKQQRTTTILAVVKGIGNELFAQIVEQLQALLAQSPYHLAVDYLDEDKNEVHRAIQLCREKKPIGLLFLGGNRQFFAEDFSKIDIPCVLVTNEASGLPFPNLSSVSMDDRKAAYAAAEILIRRGHRKIAMIGGFREVSVTSRLRYEGFRQALEDHQIPFDPQQDYQGVRFSYQDGYRATMALLDAGRQFTAIFAAADVMAIGAIRALRERGLHVPRDVSVVGVDGLPLGDYLVPRLSTIQQPTLKIAQRSIAILRSCIELQAPACHEILPFGEKESESICNI